MRQGVGIVLSSVQGYREILTLGHRFEVGSRPSQMTPSLFGQRSTNIGLEATPGVNMESFGNLTIGALFDAIQ
jgi:hypothetical protein